MKKIVLLLIILPSLLFAQTHLKNQKFIEFSLGGYDGFSSKNYALNLGLGKYNKKNNTHAIEFSFARKLANTNMGNLQVPVEQLFISYGKDFNLYNNYNNTLLISLFAKAIIGYESINRNKIGQNDFAITSKSDYQLGIGLGPNVEFNNFHLGLSSNLNFISNYQRLSTFPYIKYRFHL